MLIKYRLFITNGKTPKYVLISAPMSWNDAQNYCNKTYGSHLASFKNEDDWQQMITTIQSNDVWIGLNDFKNDGNWIWSDNISWYLCI